MVLPCVLNALLLAIIYSKSKKVGKDQESISLCFLVDFPTKINAMRMGLSFIYFKESQVGIS